MPLTGSARARRIRVMADVAIPVADGRAGGAPAGVERPDFQIVPLRALPFVGLAFAALIAAIAADRLWPLEFLHVAFGAAWTIIDLFVGFVVGPIIGRMSVP